jgi:hypothetical protein
MAFPIIFNMINVNGQNGNGVVAVGENQQNGWAAHSKQNMGVSMLFGVNYTLNNLTYIMDNDYIDAPITDNGMPISAQGQAI